MVSDVKSLDQAFNLIHGEGASLNDEDMMDPVKTTAKMIKTKCPDGGRQTVHQCQVLFAYQSLE